MLQNFFMQMWERKETTTPNLRIPTVIRWRRENQISPLQTVAVDLWSCSWFTSRAGRLFLVCLFFPPDWQGRRRRNEMIVMAHLFAKIAVANLEIRKKRSVRGQHRRVSGDEGRQVEAAENFKLSKSCRQKSPTVIFLRRVVLFFWGECLGNAWLERCHISNELHRTRQPRRGWIKTLEIPSSSPLCRHAHTHTELAN